LTTQIHDALAPHIGLLTPDDLSRLVADVAARPELWEDYIDQGSTERKYVSLHRDAHVDVWAIWWRPGSDTGWHDHDISSAGVRVVEGALTDCELRLEQPPIRRTYGAGDDFTLEPSRIHRLFCEAQTALSIHAYSPPLWRLGQYTVTPDGALRRLSVTYADELRPLDLAA
jgi:predicted metal-dependent enzyme (double-stranded beta helix superfamily)